MRVGLDARKLADFGIGTYIRALLAEFVRLGAPEELVVYLAPGADPGDDVGRAPQVTRRTERARPYSPGELWRLARGARRDRVDLFHAPHYVCPPLLPCPAVITIHDLIHLRFPRGRLAALYARVMLRLAVRRAAILLTVSESTRADLERRLGADPARIRVIPNGVGPHFRPAPDPDALGRTLARVPVYPPYWLFVGNPLPHKNLPRLLEAVGPLPASLGQLVLAGIPAARRVAVTRACAAQGLERRVVVLAPVPTETLVPLYQGAQALVCPSLWEGFGLPVLEAMACGTPVIAADRGALPEVAGGAARLVDPTDVDALRAALHDLASHEPIRAALREAGLARARPFTWTRAAEATLAAYREALAQDPRV